MLQFFPAGVLTVGVIEARKLPDRDTVGRQDPYVVLTLDGECRSFRQNTRVDTDGGRDPVWNQVFQFDVVDHYILKVGKCGVAVEVATDAAIANHGVPSSLTG